MQKHIMLVTAVLISLSLAASAQNQAPLKKVPPVALGEGDGAFASQCEAVPGNLVTNCGFETGDFTGWSQSGDLSYTAVDAVPHSGSFGAYFGPIHDLGFIAQSLATTPGQLYNLTFWLRNAQQPNRFQVFWNGVVLADSTNLGDFDYTQYTFQRSSRLGWNDRAEIRFLQSPRFLLPRRRHGG